MCQRSSYAIRKRILNTKHIIPLTIALSAALIISACTSPAKEIDSAVLQFKVDKEKIYNFIMEEDTLGEGIKDVNDIDYREANVVFKDYGARLYKCTSKQWNKDVITYFLIKGDTISYIEFMTDEYYQTDFDCDNDKELIYHTSSGSGLIRDTYYVIEKDSGSIYSGTFLFSIPLEVSSNGELIIDAKTDDGQTVRGKLAYKEENGQKTICIDTGEYKGHLYGWNWGAIPIPEKDR